MHDLRLLLRLALGRAGQPSVAIFDARVLQSSPESGGRAGYDRHKRRKGSKLLQAVDTLGSLLALTRHPGQCRRGHPGGRQGRPGQEVTGDQVELAWVDQGDTSEEVAQAAAAQGIQLAVVLPPEAKRGFILLPCRWVAERSFAWEARFRRLARHNERLPGVLAGLRFIAFVCLLLHQVIPLIFSS